MILIRPFLFFSFIILCHCHTSLNRHYNDRKRFTIQFKSLINDTQAIQQERERFLQYMQKHHVMDNIHIRYNYTDVLNGMSIELVPRALSAASLNITTNHKKTGDDFIKDTLATCPYVRRYWPGKRYARPNVVRQQGISSSYDVNDDVATAVDFFSINGATPPLVVDTGSPNLQIAHAWTTVDQAKRMGWTGKDVRVAILDTGVDYTHPSLGGCFGEGCLVRWGKDLVGDKFGNEFGDGKLRPDDDPLDQCDGHGTHIAGIIAANDTFKGFEGVAPGVTIGAWRIFGCDGDTDDDIIIAAADMAVKAGMDIINLSLGGGISSWQEDPLAVALSNIADKNIIVVVAQGNEGEDGISRTPSPAIGKHVISVGSVDNGERFGPVIDVLDNEGEIKGTYAYSMATVGTKKGFITEGPTVPFTTIEETEACDGTVHQNVTGKIVLVYQEGKCSSTRKALRLQDEGVLGMLVYPRINSTLYRRSTKIPVGSMTFEDGAGLVNLLKESTQQPNIKFTASMVKVKTAGLPSEFSTWGSDPELHFKPDISAVGGYIYSTFPVNLGAYATLSGTSMATPYLSGCIALMMQASGDRNSAIILDKLVNYAKPIEKETGLMETPIKQGSGLVQIYNSIVGDHLITPSKIALNDTMYHLNSTWITVMNKSSKKKLFTFDSMPSIGIQGYNFSISAVPLATPRHRISHANVTFERNTVELSANESVQLLVQFEQPRRRENREHTIYGGYLKIISKFINDTDEVNLSYVPYFGTVGNQRDLPIIDTKLGYPYIGDKDGHKLRANRVVAYNFPKSTKQARASDAVLHLYSRFGSPTAHVKYQLLSNGKLVGLLPSGSKDYIARNDHSDDNYDYVLDWRGGMVSLPKSNTNGCDAWMGSEDDAGNALVHVPGGSYNIRACVLKIFGDPKIAEDWETWLSPTFEVIG